MMSRIDFDRYEEYEVNMFCHLHYNGSEYYQLQQEVIGINRYHLEVQMISDACSTLLDKLNNPQTKYLPILQLTCDCTDENEIEEENTSFREVNFNLKSKRGEKKRLDFINLVQLILKLLEGAAFLVPKL